MFQLKPTETIKLFRLLADLGINDSDFVIPKESKSIIFLGVMREEYMIVHRKYSFSFLCCSWKKLDDSTSNFAYSCTPGKNDESDINKATNGFDHLLRELELWFERYKIEMKAELEKENIFQNIFSKIPDSTFSEDEPFSEEEINEVLPNALNQFKQKILVSEIPEQQQKLLIEGLDRHYEKAKSGKISKQDWFGGMIIFIGKSLANWGLKNFYDYIFHSIKEAFQMYHALIP